MKKRINAKRLMAVCCIMLLLCSTLMLSGCEFFTGDKKEEKQITTLEELNGNPIYAVMGTSNASELLSCEKLQDSEVLFATGNNDAVQKLITGKATAFVTDNVYASVLVSKYEGLKILDEPVAKSNLGFAYNKNSKYKALFDETIKKFKENGKIDEMHDKWFTADVAGLQVPKQNFKGKNGTITAVVDANFEPMAFKDEDGNLQGFDVELITEVARDNGYNVKFKEMEFSGMLANVAADNYDVAIGGLTITKDREDIVTFSTPYFSNSTLVLVKDTAVDTTSQAAKLTIGTACYRVFVENEHYNLLLKGFGMTVLFAVLTMLSANLFGFLLYLWVYSGSWIAKNIALRIRRFIQLIPGMIWLYIVFYLVFAGSNTSGFIASFVAFTIMFANVCYGILCLSIGYVDEGVKEAAYTMGYGKYQALFKLYLPYALPYYLENISIEMEGLVKTTCLIELVSVFDISAASDTILNETQVPFIPIILPAIAYMIIAVAVSKIFKILEIMSKRKIEDPAMIDEKILKGMK